MSGTNRELDVLKTQIGNLCIYAHELQMLEQWDMPSEWRERAVKIRNESAPMFFNMVAGLLLDALVQGLANFLDLPATGRKDNLTLEYAIEQMLSSNIKTSCKDKLSTIRCGKTYKDIKRARNHILSHSDYNTMINYAAMTPNNFPNLKLKDLESLVREIRQIMAEMSGLPAPELIPMGWKGVDHIFELLETKKGSLS